jgi:hypothetical protein
MKTKPTQFRKGDIARVKTGATAEKLLKQVWLNPSEATGRTVVISELGAMHLGRTKKFSCHLVARVSDGMSMYLPASVMKFIRHKHRAKA